MFLGVGYGKAIALLIFVILGIVFLKTILNKYPVSGLTEVMNAV